MLSPSHHPGEKDYWRENVEIETSDGRRRSIGVCLLRIYPETFNGCDAYMDIPLAEEVTGLSKVYSQRLGIVWRVATEPVESPIEGMFRGDYSENNPPVWMIGLRRI